jgi:hypothetical protein
MRSKRDIYKDRISTLIDIWGSIMSKWPNLTREELIGILKSRYEEKGIKPFRGFKAEGLYEKELTSLYVVGKHGLGLDKENPEIFEELLGDEIRFERLSQILEKESEETLEDHYSTTDEISRALRLVFTGVTFSFFDEERLISLLRRLSSSTKEDLVHVSKSFGRFFVAFKLAEMIASNEIRDRLSLEAMKKALHIKLGIQPFNARPEYIALIAREVFNVNESKLKRILNYTGRELQEKDL